MPELITAQDEARFDRWTEKQFRKHRDTPSGRNFATWNHPNFAQGKRKLEQNFDKAFSGSPSSEAWFDKNFCSGCGKRLAWCECGKRRND